MSFAFTGNLRRVFLGAGLHGAGAADTQALNLVDLVATNRMHVDLYLTPTPSPVYSEAALEAHLTIANFVAGASGLGIYNGATYNKLDIAGGLVPTIDNPNNRLTFIPGTTAYNWSGLGAPSSVRYLRYLLVSVTPSSGVGAATKIPLFAYDGGGVNGADLVSGGAVNVDLPMVLAIGSIGV